MNMQAELTDYISVLDQVKYDYLVSTDEFINKIEEDITEMDVFLVIKGELK